MGRERPSYSPPSKRETIKNIVTGAILAKFAGDSGENGKTVDFSKYNNTEEAFAEHYRKVFRIMPQNYDEKLFFSRENPYLEDLMKNVQLAMPAGKSIDDLEKVEFSKKGNINLAYRMDSREGAYQWVSISLDSEYHKAIDWIKTKLKDRKSPTEKKIEQKVKEVVEKRRQFKRNVASDIIESDTKSSLEYPSGNRIDAKTISKAAKEASNSTENINEVLERQNFMKVVNYVAETVGIPAPALLSVMYSETRFKFDKELVGPGGEIGLGQFMKGTWKFIRKTRAFKSCVGKFGIDTNIGRAENVLADITGIAVLLKRGLNRTIDHTSVLSEEDYEVMRFHYHVPGYRRAIMEGKGTNAYIAKAKAFVARNKAQKERKYGPDEVGKYGYLYYAKNAQTFQKAWEKKFAGGKETGSNEDLGKYGKTWNRENVKVTNDSNQELEEVKKDSGISEKDFSVDTKGDTTTLTMGEYILKMTGKIEKGMLIEIKDGEIIREFRVKEIEKNKFKITIPNSKVKLTIEVKGLEIIVKGTNIKGAKIKKTFNLLNIKNKEREIDEFLKNNLELNSKEAKEKSPESEEEIQGEFKSAASGKPGKYHLKSGQKRWIVGSSSVEGNCFSTGEKYDGMAKTLTEDSGYYGVSSEHPENFLNGFKNEIEPQLDNPFKFPNEVIIAGLGYMGVMADKTNNEILASYEEIKTYFKSKGVKNVRFTTVQTYSTQRGKQIKLTSFNKALKKKYTNNVIDTSDIATEENKHTDNIHLNDEATKKLAARLEGKVEE